MDDFLFGGDDIIYLPKDSVVANGATDTTLIPVDEPVAQPESTPLPSQVLDHFIGQARYHWGMNFCLCRQASGCTDYPIDLGCLFWTGRKPRNTNKYPHSSYLTLFG